MKAGHQLHQQEGLPDFRDWGVAKQAADSGSRKDREVTVIVSEVVAFPVDREGAGMGTEEFTGRSEEGPAKEIE